MYSKEEAKLVRQQFWTLFGKRYDRKWIRYHTKMKDVVLKFEFEDRKAIVALDLEHSDPFYRSYYFEKICSLKSILQDEFEEEVLFDENYVLANGKTIARIYVYKEGVKIQRKTDWPEVYEFFYDQMNRLEHFFMDYKEIIDS